MRNVALDYRHGVRQRLEEAGFDETQVQALVGAMTAQEDRLATKTDVEGIKTDVAELKVGLAAVNGRVDGLVMAVEGLRLEVRERIDSFRQEVSARLEASEARVMGRIDGVEGKINGKIDGMSGQLTMIKWLLGFLLASTVPIMLALLRLAFFPQP